MANAVSRNDSVLIGRWWFQRRGVSPLPLVLLCLVLPPEQERSAIQLVYLLAGILLAEGVRVWAVGFAGSATRTRGDSVPGLVHAGPFRFVRNPLYLANMALYTLVAVAFGFTWLSFGFLLYFLIQYTFIVAFEEDTLKREFGAAYGLYCARVPRWVPRFTPGVEASAHRFQLGKALRSERATLIALTVMAGLFFIKRLYLN
ncbi:isoprenylcysteine carboxylmethyltransferase family protein [bacterium]|nr:isoprenylcysteine carboxylmethyltransferase family protein [bacterium]